MQPKISNDVHIGQSVTPFKSLGKSPATDKTASDFDNANLKLKMIRKLIEHRVYDADIARYIPETLNLVFQGVIDKIKAIEQLADTTNKDKEKLDFELILDKNNYTNLKSLQICFPVKFKKFSNLAQDVDANFYPVNNFFAH